MKTNQVTKSLNYYTGILVKEYDIIRWANEGLLGEIDRFKVTSPTSKHRNFSNTNFERALLIVFITRVLSMPWDNNQLLRYLDTNDKAMNHEIAVTIEKLETKGIPRFKQIILEREKKNGV